MKHRTLFQCGQAMTEYVIVIVFCILVLIVGTAGDPSPMDRLITAIKDFYAAFSYAISVSA